MMMTVTMMTTTAPLLTGAASNDWLACLALQTLASLLSLACFSPTDLTNFLSVTAGLVLVLVTTVASIPSLKTKLYNQLKPLNNGFVASWFVGSLLLVPVHPALLVLGLFPLVQFQRFTQVFKTPKQVGWVLSTTALLVVGAVAWQWGFHPPHLQSTVFGLNTTLCLLISFMPLLAWYIKTQVRLKFMLEAQNGELQQQSTLALTDALTGLGNRRYFDETLRREMARTKRNGSPLSLVLLDIDFFKKINDVYGHTMGDVVLKELATLILSNLRQCDWIARYGGEEYALILPDTPCLEALKLLERLRVLVERQVFARNHAPLKITVSLGITQYDVKRHTLESLVAEADEALYEAKHHGRNQVRVYGLGASGGTLVPQPIRLASVHTVSYHDTV